MTNKTNLLITTTVAVSLLTSTFISPLKANAEAQQSVKSQNFSVDNITYTNDKIIIDNYNARVYSKTQYNYYKYHDYTSYINTVTKYQACQPHGCAAPTFKRY
ncbi:hypothetical protein KYI12_12480 (plasmid) [Macrococcus psychrotolerans]|nr:hypothetical protein [Macrococcus caseolyticus]QYA77698.1 hypothetical protein KYI12_12395 [Macrococcus caseolyticus]QYA77715.1 hypothetical protein KYI12_12480 [Macrococcus caseolyticus]